MSRKKKTKRRKEKRRVPANLFKLYLREVRGFSLLEAEEEERLARVLEEGRQATKTLAEIGVQPSGDRGGALHREDLAERERRGREARDQLAVANLRLAVSIAKRYVWRGRFHGLQLPDLVQEGNLALVLAASHFKSGYGKFATFATPVIRQRIDGALAGKGRLIRLPVRVRKKLHRLRQEEHWYLGEKGRPPTPEELAAALGITVEALAELRCAEQTVISLSAPLPGNQDEEDLVYEDAVADPKGMALVERAEDRQWLDWLLAGLDERKRRVLEWHFGHGLTLDEIGKRENVSRERVRQIARDALEKVRR